VEIKMKKAIPAIAILSLFGLLAVINVVTDAKPFDPNDPKWDKVSVNVSYHPTILVYRKEPWLGPKLTSPQFIAAVDKIDKQLEEANKNRALQYASPAALPAATQPAGPRQYKPAGGWFDWMKSFFAAQKKERLPLPCPPVCSSNETVAMMDGSPWRPHE
jgi:hypothetical protein